MKKYLIILLVLALCLLFFTKKHRNKISQFIGCDIVMLGDSHIERGDWNELLDTSVVNFSKGGATVQEISELLPGVINCRPKICFIECGINDIITGVPLDTTIVYYNNMISSLRDHNIQPVILKVMPTLISDTVNYRVLKLNDKLCSLAPVIESGVTTDDLSADKVHLKASGYKKLVLTIKAILRR